MSIECPERPREFTAVMFQRWEKLLFIHWPIDVEALRPLIPSRLSIDTYQGTAYVAVVPFTMSGIRARWLPPLPGLSAFHELNVRTYVTLDGKPGVWFLSLDATNVPAIVTARRLYYLNYVRARMRLDVRDGVIYYRSRRMRGPGGFRGEYTPLGTLPRSEPGSLAHFLTERYCLYAQAPHGRLIRCRIAHEPWPLRKATLADFETDMLEANGLMRPDGEPLLHYAERIGVWIGWPEDV